MSINRTFNEVRKEGNNLSTLHKQMVTALQNVLTIKWKSITQVVHLKLETHGTVTRK
jgi:ABC-type nitrate/sulfonate/bicarbonate transport system ATPase subunit